MAPSARILVSERKVMSEAQRREEEEGEEEEEEETSEETSERSVSPAQENADMYLGEEELTGELGETIAVSEVTESSRA